MAKKFKDYYGTPTARLISEKIAAVEPQFPTEALVKLVSTGIRGKEFLARQDVFAEALHSCLGPAVKKNLQVFRKILGPELQTDTGMFTHGYWLWPIGRYVERYGTKAPKESLNFIYELTKRFTGEFAIRPLLEQFPKETVRAMEKWSRDKNVHVRRLASEGMRVSLPWAKKSLICLQYFAEYRRILGNLKNDPAKFVQKSVGNNLNDLYKVAPEKATSIINEWKNESVGKETAWIINHGLRSTRKKIKGG